MIKILRDLFKSDKSDILVKKLSKDLTLTCVDVGCAGGFDQVFDRLSNQQSIKFYGYEPNKEEFNKLSKLKNLPPKYKFYNIALSNSLGSKTLYSNSTVSSLSKRKDRELRFGENFQKKKVKCSTLFECRKSNSIPNEIDILKIDTEGSEVNILKGAGKLIDNEVLCIKSEFQFDSPENTNKFTEIDTLLTNKGFKLMGLTMNKSQNGGLEGGDCLYMFDPSLKSKRKYSKFQLKKLAIISYSFGFIDFCSLLPIFCEKKMSKEDIMYIENLASSKIFLPHLIPFCYLKLAHIFSLISQLLMGRKSESKSSPSPNRLLPYKITLVKSSIPFLKKIRTKQILIKIRNIKLLLPMIKKKSS